MNKYTQPSLIVSHLLNLRLPDGNNEVLPLRLVTHRKISPIKQLLLQKNHRIRIPNSRLKQPLRVLTRIRRQHLQPRHARIPRRKTLTMLRRHPRRDPVRPPENDRARDVARRHVILFRGAVDNLVDGLHAEVERHELDDGLEVFVGGAYCEAGETHFGYGGVDYATVAVFLVEAWWEWVKGVRG
jgi:hypothetical protein